MLSVAKVGSNRKVCLDPQAHQDNRNELSGVVNSDILKSQCDE